METTKKGEIMKHFITFEGIDGSGKTTILELIYHRLKTNGYDVVKTYEPTDTWIGKCVKRCIQTETDPFVTTFTFIADRIAHGKQIQQWLDDGKIVLCDRYAESTYAYQSVQLRPYIRNPVKWLQELSQSRILIPDRTFVFILDPKIALARIQHRGALIPFEQVSFLTQVQENYKKLAVGKRFLLVDAGKTKEEIVDICYNDILH